MGIHGIEGCGFVLLHFTLFDTCYFGFNRCLVLYIDFWLVFHIFILEYSIIILHLHSKRCIAFHSDDACRFN